MIRIKFTIKLNCTIKLYREHGVDSGKSVFPTSFGRGRFQGNLFSFEKQKWLQKILFDVNFLEIYHNGFAFFLTVVDEK